MNNKFENYVSNVLHFADIKNRDVIAHLIEVIFNENNNKAMKRYVLIQKLATLLDSKIEKEVDRIIQDILDERLKSGEFVYNIEDDAYNMSESKYIEAGEYMDRFILLQERFKKEFSEFITKESSYMNDSQLSSVSDNIVEFINRYLYNNGVMVFQKIMNQEYNHFIEDDIKDIVFEVYNKYDFDIVILAEIEKMIKRFLLNMNGHQIDYIIEILNQVIFLKLYGSINVKSNKIALKERIFYLDTNVIIPLIFNNHPESNSVRYIIKSCMEQGITLRIANITMNEYKRQFEYLKHVDRRFINSDVYKRPRIMRNLSKLNIDNDIYHYYLMNRGTHKSFNLFIEHFCDNILILLDNYNIELDENIDEEFKLEGKYEELFQSLYKLKQNDIDHVTENSVEHDLILMKYINGIRKEDSDIDELGNKIWIITLEKRLEQFRLNNKDFFNNQITICIDELYDFLLPFYIEEKKFTKDYVEHLINSNIGIYDYKDEKNVNLNVLSCIFESGIDINQLEGLTDEQQLNYIYTIQSNKKVVETCQSIIKANESDKEDGIVGIDITEMLKLDLKELTNEQARKFEEEKQDDKIVRLSDELRETKDENLELIEFKEKYYNILEKNSSNQKETKLILVIKRIERLLQNILSKIRQTISK